MICTTHNTQIINRIEALMNKLSSLSPKEINYVCETKLKYYKIVALDSRILGDQCVHCFVDRTNGNVYKPHNWHKPDPRARFNLLEDPSFRHLLNTCDIDGTYLYHKIYKSGHKSRSAHRKGHQAKGKYSTRTQADTPEGAQDSGPVLES